MTDISNNKLGIKCQWMEMKRALVNPDGQVFPCCFFANAEYISTILGIDPKEWKIERYGLWEKGDPVNENKNYNVIFAYKETKKDHNIFNHKLGDIVNNEWFTKILPESFNDENKCHRLCKKMCSTRQDDK